MLKLHNVLVVFSRAPLRKQGPRGWKRWELISSSPSLLSDLIRNAAIQGVMFEVGMIRKLPGEIFNAHIPTVQQSVLM
jgi:hypothetical protein